MTLEEFIEYYTNVGISIESDDYFQQMINNSWNLTGSALTYQNFGKNWAHKDDDAKSVVSNAQSEAYKTDLIRRQQVMLKNKQCSVDNPLYSADASSYYKGY